MANIFCGNTTMRILNRSNLYSGDGWRLLGPRELSKYILSDLNSTINPKLNPWSIVQDLNDVKGYTFYQSSHKRDNKYVPVWRSDGITFTYDRSFKNYGWVNIDQVNYYAEYYGNQGFTSLFLYQYVESENATNIYY